MKITNAQQRRFVPVYLLPCIAILALLLGAADGDPPTPVEPPPAERNFTIKGSSLTIQPGTESTYLRFGGGIVCSAKDMHLSADELELDISTGNLQTEGKFKFPSVPKPLGRVVDDPGEVAQAMGNELELPKASFSGNAITRVGAKGNVKVESRGICLETSELVSTDGGNSWMASGRTSISSEGFTGNGSIMLATDNLFFDVVHSSALAKGAVDGHYYRDGFEPVAIKAQRLELNQNTGVLIISGNVEVEYGSITLRCGQPADKNEITGSDQANGAIEFHLDSRLVAATGGVVLTESSEAMKLTADEITVSLEEMWAEATGNPLVERGESSFSGERILVTDLDGKVVVEVSGPQGATLVPDELTPDENVLGKENPRENPGT